VPICRYNDNVSKRSGKNRKLLIVVATLVVIALAIVVWNRLHPAPTLLLPEIVYYEVDNIQQTRSQNPIYIWLQSLLSKQIDVGTLKGTNTDGKKIWKIRKFNFISSSGRYYRPAYCAEITDGMFPLSESQNKAGTWTDRNLWLNVTTGEIIDYLPEWGVYSDTKYKRLIPIYDKSKPIYSFREYRKANSQELIFNFWDSTSHSWARLQLLGLTEYAKYIYEITDAAFFANNLVLVATIFLGPPDTYDITKANIVSFYDLTTDSFDKHYVLCITDSKSKPEPFLAEVFIDNDGEWKTVDSALNRSIAHSKPIGLDKGYNGFTSNISFVRPPYDGKPMSIYLTWSPNADNIETQLQSGFFNLDADSGMLTPSGIIVDKDLRLLPFELHLDNSLNFFQYEPKSGTAITPSINTKTTKAVLLIISSDDKVKEVEDYAYLHLYPGVSVSPNGFIWYARIASNQLTLVRSISGYVYYSDLIRYDPATGTQTVVVANAPISGIWSWLE
jgi:hypothetical protein